MSDPGRPGSGPIRFKTTFTNTIYEVMKMRGWKETNSDSDWDFIWAERDTAHDTFDTRHLLNWQRVNHFRNDRELCRKDLLVKNLKKRKRSIQRDGQQDEADRHDFWPTTYVLPGEYALFAEESKRRPNSKWIMKPIARSQGRGIFIVTKLSQISKWKSDSRWEKTKEDGPETYVVQRYVTNPYLFAGRKFDMRLYVLVTSYMPMTVWVYRAGFCRFSHARYSNATEDLEDMGKHLTNIAIQKRTENYDKGFGGKWGIRQLKLHLMGLHGVPAVNDLFYEIQLLIVRSLLSVQQVMINDKHCFGLYGYDILFDEKLKPWLLEVNASPSLSANTPADKELKVAMLSSALDVIDLEGRNHGDEIRVGGFDLIHAGGNNASWAARTGGRGSLYTTALGTEIPQQRVERMPRPSESSSLPPSGAGGGNGVDSSTRRHTTSSFSGAAAAGGGGGGGGAGATGGEGGGGGGGGGAGGGGSAASPARTQPRGAGVSGGSGGSSVGSGSSRSSSSMARSTRTNSSDSLPKETANRGECRAGRSDAGVRGASRGGDRSGTGRDAGGGNGVGAGARASGGAKCARNSDRESSRDHRDRGEQRAGGKDKSNRDRGVGGGGDARGEAASASGAAEDVLARSLPPTRRGSASTDTEKLLAMPSRKGIHSS